MFRLYKILAGILLWVPYSSILYAQHPTHSHSPENPHHHPDEHLRKETSIFSGKNPSQRSAWSVTISPDTLTVDHTATVTFEITTAAGGIEVGGGLQMEIPVATEVDYDHFWSPLQLTDSTAPGFVRVWSSGTSKFTLDKKNVRILECTVTDTPVPPNGKVYITYTGKMQRIAKDQVIRFKIHTRLGISWAELDTFPTITFLPSEPVWLNVVTPSDLQKGQEFTMAVVVLDKFGNLVPTFDQTVHFTSTDPDAAIPGSYTFTTTDSGIHEFTGLYYHTPGYQKISVTSGNLHDQCNYTLVHDTLPAFQRYFGETHFHTGTGMGNATFQSHWKGGDHRGQFTTEEEAYAYIRDVVRLDFASAAEHDHLDFVGPLWENSQAITAGFHEEGKFTTFFAYEWGLFDYGHRVVLYKDSGNSVFSGLTDHYNTPPELWEALDQQNTPALTIPHLMVPVGSNQMWDYKSNKYQKIGEIYSVQNLLKSETGADEPQMFELGIDNVYSFQYAWHHDHRIGVIGSSDNHLGNPGINNYKTYTGHAGGLAVVIATGNNRPALWEAMEARKTYATTGTRIHMSLDIAGHPMGSEFLFDQFEMPVSLQVAGTDILESIELIKYRSGMYEVFFAAAPGAETFTTTLTDDQYAALDQVMYYLRVRQKDGEMAWSSPIWVNMDTIIFSNKTLPDQYALLPNNPNPACNHTSLNFHMVRKAPVQLTIFDSQGKRIRDLFRGELEAGVYKMGWDGQTNEGREVSAGLYIATMKAEDFTDARKMIFYGRCR